MKIKEISEDYTIGFSDGFAEGYKAAFEWISVEDKLPNSDRAILAANFDDSIRPIWASNVRNGLITPIDDPFFGSYNATHWREIEIPE
jgi:Protein of unknown function (DUF551).